MNNIVSHLDITRIFCEVDDFCQSFEKHWQEQPLASPIALAKVATPSEVIPNNIALPYQAKTATMPIATKKKT